MKLILVLCLVSTLVTSINAQTLFEDADKPGIPISIPPKKTINVPTQKAHHRQFISANLESVILRGDIQLMVESPRNDGWSAMAMVHANPQGDFNRRTGKLGGALGGRIYVDSKWNKAATFLQVLGGFDYYKKWDLMIGIEVGQRFKWKDTIFLDVSMNVDRSYAADFKNPMAYLNARLTFAFDRKVIHFL